MLIVPNKASLATLPKLPGVFALSKMEIKKDLREMMREVAFEEDTDGSVKSDDILSSTYPVKPRRAPRRDRSYPSDHLMPHDSVDYSSSSVQIDIEEKLRFINMVESSKPEFVAADALKEERDVLLKALSEATGHERTTFGLDKKLQENYFHLMQAMHIRMLQLRSAYLLRNMVLLDVHDVIAQRNAAVASIRASTPRGESNVLRVSLEPSGRRMLFYRGQRLETPYGRAEVVRILPTVKKLEVQLPFGTLHTTVAAAIGWSINLPASADALTDDFLLHSWAAMEGTYNAPPSYENRLRQLLAEMDGEDGETDGDEEEPEAEAAIKDPDSPAVEEAELSTAHKRHLIGRPIRDVPDAIFPYVFVPPGQNIAVLPFLPSI